MPNIDYPGAQGVSNSDLHGFRPNVKSYGAKGDVRVVTDASATSSDKTLTSATANFTSDDLTKKIIVFGAGSSGAGDRESLIAEIAVTQTSTNSMVVFSGSTLDAQAASSVKYAFNCDTNAITWEVWSDDNSDFSTETRVYGPTSQTELLQSDSYTDSSPSKRYYRVKIQSTTTDEHGLGYLTGIALGYLHSSTIAAVTDSQTIEMVDAATATRESSLCHFGTDDTTAIQAAIDALYNQWATTGGDGGLTLYFPRGIYLISSKIHQRKNITCIGANGSGTIILCDGANFPASTTVWQIGHLLADLAEPAFFCRLEDIRIDCAHVPGSVGIYSEAVQENSGLRRVTCIKWVSKGIHFSGFGVQHYRCEDLWIYPSNSTFLDATAIGIHLQTNASPNRWCRVTVLGQGGFIVGYGKAVYLNGVEASFTDLHIEACAIGVHFDTSVYGAVERTSGHQTVETLFKIDTSNSVWLNHYTNSGRYEIEDTFASGLTFKDTQASRYMTTVSPTRVRGNHDSDNDIWQFIPGTFLGGKPSLRVRRKGGLRVGDGQVDEYPNHIVLDPLQFEQPQQGGWICVNSENAGFPNWQQVSQRYAFTVDAGTDIFTATGHPFSNDDTVQGFNEGGSLPTGMSTGPDTTYYVIGVTGDTFQLSTSQGGSAINVTDTGTGTHYIARYVGAAFHRFGASRYETRYGDAANAEGTDPGTLAFRVDRTTGAYAPLLFCQSTEETKLGNEQDVNRLRMWHGDASQASYHFERSTNSGVAWDKILSLLLDKKAVQMYRLYFTAAPGEELEFGNDLDVNQTRWSHGGTAQKYLKLERSTNSGSSYTDFIILNIATGDVEQLAIGKVWNVDFQVSDDSTPTAITVTGNNHVSQGTTAVLDAELLHSFTWGVVVNGAATSQVNSEVFRVQAGEARFDGDVRLAQETGPAAVYIDGDELIQPATLSSNDMMRWTGSVIDGLTYQELWDAIVTAVGAATMRGDINASSDTHTHTGTASGTTSSVTPADPHDHTFSDGFTTSGPSA